jgi:glycosyltransferase involved in cell wall biosynthesis
VGGIPEIVEDGVEGILVEPMDVNQLAENCRRLIESPETAMKMGEQAQKRVAQEFSAAAMADRVAGLYKELVMSR